MLVAKARLERASQAAFADEKSRHEVAIALAEFELKRAERKYAANLLERSTVVAERGGILVYADKDRWIGRPVKTGERIMQDRGPGGRSRPKSNYRLRTPSYWHRVHACACFLTPIRFPLSLGNLSARGIWRNQMQSNSSFIIFMLCSIQRRINRHRSAWNCANSGAICPAHFLYSAAATFRSSASARSLMSFGPLNRNSYRLPELRQDLQLHEGPRGENVRSWDRL